MAKFSLAQGLQQLQLTAPAIESILTTLNQTQEAIIPLPGHAGWQLEVHAITEPGVSVLSLSHAAERAFVLYFNALGEISFSDTRGWGFAPITGAEFIQHVASMHPAASVPVQVSTALVQHMQA